MRNYVMSFLLAGLVVMTGLSVRRSVAAFDGGRLAPSPGTSIGGSPIPWPPAAGIGGSPIPWPKPKNR